MLYLFIGILAALFLAYFAWTRYKGKDKDTIRAGAEEQFASGTSGGAVGDMLSSPGVASGIGGGALGDLFGSAF